jgi:hypothetical protein
VLGSFGEVFFDEHLLSRERNQKREICLSNLSISHFCNHEFLTFCKARSLARTDAAGSPSPRMAACDGISSA